MEPYNDPLDTAPRTITTHAKPAPGSKIDTRVRKALREYRVTRRKQMRIRRRNALTAWVDFRDPEVRRILRNARKAAGRAVFS